MHEVGSNYIGRRWRAGRIWLKRASSIWIPLCWKMTAIAMKIHQGDMQWRLFRFWS